MKAPEICVPLSTLSLPGESGGDVPPAQGDELDFSGKATVSRVEGKYAYLTPTEINGNPVESSESPEQEKGIDDEEAEMRADAKKTDREAGLFS